MWKQILCNLLILFVTQCISHRVACSDDKPNGLAIRGGWYVQNDRVIWGYGQHNGWWRPGQRPNLARRAPGQIGPNRTEDLDRLREFADLCDRKGTILFHNGYMQHALLERQPHYADFPWRPVNCIQPPGMPDRFPAANVFYDNSHGIPGTRQHAWAALMAGGSMLIGPLPYPDRRSAPPGTSVSLPRSIAR